MPTLDILKCRTLLPRGSPPINDLVETKINEAEDIVELACAPVREWSCEGTLVILTADESHWRAASQPLPEPATRNVRLQQMPVLCKDLAATAHNLFGYQPIHEVVVALYSDPGWRFIAEVDRLDAGAKQGLVTLAHYVIDTAEGDFGAAAASISRGVSVLINEPLSIEQFVYGAMAPHLVVAGIFRSMEEWNSALPLRKELAAKGMLLLGHVGAEEARRQAALEQIASAIADDGGSRPFAPKSDLTFVGLREGKYVDLLANEYEVDSNYEEFDPEAIRTVCEWRHDTFRELCEYAQTYENAILALLGRYHDPREAVHRIRAEIHRGHFPRLIPRKPRSSAEKSLRHGLQNLIQKTAHRRAFSARGGA